MRTPFSEKFARGLVGILDKAAWSEDLHPRDESGRWAEVPGLGTPKGPVEIFDEKELRETLPQTKTGKQFFEGVNVDLIRHAFKYDEKFGGIKALVIKKDGMRTYRYTDEHNQKKSEKKFKKQGRMDGVIEPLRGQVEKDLISKDENKRASATIVKIIDTTTMRVGGGRSEERTGSSGASTLKPEHFSENPDGSLRVQFKGKSGVEWDRSITDPALVKNIKGFMEGKKPGENVFPIGPGDVNGYLRRWKVTAKDFRTFHASRFTSKNLEELPEPKTAKEAKANVKAAIEKTAEFLGHTPSVCKSAYINPFIIQTYLAKVAERKGKRA